MGSIDKIVKKHQDGVVLSLFVTAGSRKIVFPAGVNNWRNSIKINVSAPAKDNKANKEVIKTVADFFKKPVNDVFVLTGSKNQKKKVFVKCISVDFVSDKLRE
jgi:hypothetical protein